MQIQSKSFQINYHKEMEGESPTVNHHSHSHGSHGSHHSNEKHKTGSAFVPSLFTNYKITSAQYPTKCIEVSEDAKHHINLTFQEYHGGPNQMFNIEADHGKFIIKAANGKGVISVLEESNHNNADLGVGKAQNHKSEHWEILEVAEGDHAGKAWYLKSFCGKALEVKHKETTVVQHSWSGSIDQMWELTPV